MMDGMDDELAALIAFVRRHPRLMVLTGAGCSTDCGIPDYRDIDGQWKRAQPITFQAFTGSAIARCRYWARSLIGWPVMAQAQPGPAHRALAALEQAGHVSLLLTQNVDGLHHGAGSRYVIDLHGRVDTVRCLGCGCRTARAALQRRLLEQNPDWRYLSAVAAPDGDADLPSQDFSDFQVPSCSHCQGLLKPDVVFFGEGVPRERVDAAFAALDAADALLVAGSSLMVYSGYRFVQAAHAAGKPIAAINLGRTRADDLLDLKLARSTGPALQALANALLQRPVVVP